jgi:hypothetical protein
MFINTTRETKTNKTYTVFDTETGIYYALVIEPEKEKRERRVEVVVSSISASSDMALVYRGDEALDFWEKFIAHPNVGSGSNLEWWLTMAFNWADDVLATREK